jgi:uridine kinase
MRGDKLVIRDEHRKAARGIAEFIVPLAQRNGSALVITIAGESGAGKSEIAHVVQEILSQRGFHSVILQQDDYFVHPPKTNEEMRRKDIGHVGTSEVKLDLLDENLEDVKRGKSEIEKPLVIFDEDRINSEKVSLEDVDVVLVEGTYTTVLKNADRRVFIELTCFDTREARSERARELQDDFLEEILRIEHEIISKHRALADLIVTCEYEVVPNDERI